MNAAWLSRPATARRYALASAILLLGAIVFRRWLTGTMATHMLAHIPMILLAGVFAAMACLAAARRSTSWRRPAALALYRKYNEHGVPGLLLVSFVLAYWMIPRSLDHVLLSATAGCLKFLGLFIAGMVLFDALGRADKVIKLFFLGNFSWMTAIAGLLYQDNPERLCNFYLLGDQELAGRALVTLAVALPLAWLWAERRHSRRLRK
ncbi:MAG: hypothetical protein ACTS5Y_03940 [Pollutimonas bauzanensis]